MTPSEKLLALEAENLVLRAALEFYAQGDNWVETPSRDLANRHWSYTTIWKDSARNDDQTGGQRARNALLAAPAPDIAKLLERLVGALKREGLTHIHAPDLPHTRALGDTYGWCDYCSGKVHWGLGNADQVLDDCRADLEKLGIKV